MKKLSIDHFLFFLFLSCCLLALTSCFKGLTQKRIIFTDDFEAGDLKGITIENFFGPITYNKILNYNGSRVLGGFNNSRITLAIDGIPEHNTVNVEFDLNIHDKWEGNKIGAGGIPDIWVMEIDNNLVLSTTFSNTSNAQAYPNFYTPAGGVPPRANAFDINVPGFCSSKGVSNGSSSYRIAKMFPHTASVFKFSCTDALQPFNDSCLKSWSIDNLIITAIKY